MYQKSISIIRNSIFPVFLHKIDGSNHTISAAGTGFFINENGYFLTANHVIKSNPDKNFNPVYFGNLPFSTTGKPIAITEIYSDAVRDIYLGKINSDLLPHVKLNFEKQNEGTSVVLSGYPLPVIKSNNQGGFDLGSVRQYWQPTTIIDQFEHYTVATPAQTFSYGAYMTQHASLNGMSGAPVCDINGEVIGLSMATANRKVLQSDGEMRVDNGIILKINYIIDVLNLAKN